MPSHSPVAGFRKPLRSGAGSRATSAWPRIAALPRAKEPLLLLDGLPLSPSAWRPENPEGTAFHWSKASHAAPMAVRQVHFSQLSLTRCQQYWGASISQPWADRNQQFMVWLYSITLMMPNRCLRLHSTTPFTKHWHNPSWEAKRRAHGRVQQEVLRQPSLSHCAALHKGQVCLMALAQ